jgi:uncharacterized protein
MHMTASRREIGAVLATGLGHLIVADRLGLRLAFIVAACLFWGGYAAVRARGRPAVLAGWGFTTRNLGRSLAALAPIAAAAAVLATLYGLLAGTLLWHWHILPIALLYPLWGLVQQFLLVSLVAANLRRHGRLGDRGAILSTALLFAVVHGSSLPLAVAAFLLATITTTVYFRDGNLWALGLFHGWFATGLYYLVLGRDPWREVIAAGLWP